MKQAELIKLQEYFKIIVNKYLRVFVKKQGYEFSYWVSDDVGGIACFIEQYFFNFDDIRQDIDKKAKKGAIFKWQDENVEVEESINYNSYLMGLRVKHIKKNKSTITKIK